ncbi:hypothetical protein bas19_0055 [Escherichia phage ChristophMerian]|nr:hypothetical protein bas19_0055 [Escherichia phage ChristophMerian]
MEALYFPLKLRQGNEVHTMPKVRIVPESQLDERFR